LFLSGACRTIKTLDERENAMTVGEIAAEIQAEICGDAAREIIGAAGLEDAMPNQVSFLANPRYLRAAEKSDAGAIVLGRDAVCRNGQAVLLRVENPSKAFAKICAFFAPEPIVFPQGIHAAATVSPEARLGDGCSVQPGAVIEAGAEIGAGCIIGANSYVGHFVRMGEGCHIYPNVTIRERTQIGRRVVIHAGAVIGADGFGFDITSETAEKIPQTGIVKIDDNVEIGANTTVDRARFGQTWIQEGVKIDNLVQIAHNVVVGKNSLLAAQSGVSGSTRLGQRVIIGGQGGLVGHIHIGDHAIITAQAGVSKDVPPRTMVAGHHARPIQEEHKTEAAVKRLPDLIKKIREMEKEIELLKQSRD